MAALKVTLGAVSSLAATVLLLLSSPCAAETDRPVSELLRLNPGAFTRFEVFQSEWLEWLAAVQRADRERAESAVAGLLEAGQDLGLEWLPDFSLAASGRAIGFAREGRFDEARLCLESAERFEPQRPETSFAAAQVQRLSGQSIGAVRHAAQAHSRLFRDRLSSLIWSTDLLYWVLFIVLGTGALFVIVLMATHGIELFHDVYSFVCRFVPDAAALVATIGLLAWPVILPAGVLWLSVYWSILLWSYGSRGERALLIGIWIVLGAAPILINDRREELRVAMAPSVLLMESLANGQLQGSLFGDLAALRNTLPESTAVSQLLADLHCRLGEWDSARTLYVELLEVEPDNGLARLNLGACFFNRGDPVRAMESFQQALTSEVAAAAAHFNMSQILSDNYRFRESERELIRARRLAPREVSEWMRRAETEQMVILDGGLARAEEVVAELVEAWRDQPGRSRLETVWPRVLSLPLAVAFIAIAVGLHLIVRPGAAGPFRPAPPMAPEGSWRSVFLPGLAEAENGNPVRGFLVLAVIVAFASLPLVSDLGYRLPWIFSPGDGWTAALAVAGIGLFMLARMAIVKVRGV